MRRIRGSVHEVPEFPALYLPREGDSVRRPGTAHTPTPPRLGHSGGFSVPRRRAGQGGALRGPSGTFTPRKHVPPVLFPAEEGVDDTRLWQMNWKSRLVDKVEVALAMMIIAWQPVTLRESRADNMR